ncbi:MAG: helix-turn-helix transcriptional regulator [Deltaproteobacteria bacterium]|nr:helix-turn-helix transcriptional regulator [Deltaproteobacteria bacterium]
MQAARRVLVRRGLAATTLDAIAEEAGLTKAAIYYYFPSKDALFFELVSSTVAAQAHAIDDAVARTETGTEAIAALIRGAVEVFAPSMDDFRIAFLHGQVAGPASIHVAAEQLARIRPLNDIMYAGAARRLEADRAKRRSRIDVKPRMLAFLAHMSAIGILTMKGMVESVNDPLLYSDDELIDAMAQVFAAAIAE